MSRIRPQTWWADAAGLVVAVLVVGGPALFTKNGFAVDFTNHLWLVSVQEYAISHHLAPTYFISAPVVGVFYPFFLFYGGTLYAATGALAALAGGDVVAAYVVVTLLAIAAAYGGCLWLARQLGVRSWMAHAPAIAFVASAYYVTNLYGRGAWPEVVATSVYPLFLASGWRLVRSPRIEPLPTALFVISGAVFAGSHNVTLLLGSLVALVAIVFLVPAAGAGLLPRDGRRALALGALLMLAIAVDAWFLLPDVLYGSRTQIGAAAVFPWSPEFNTPGTLFDPLRSVPIESNTPALYVQAPVWFLAWALAAAVALWSRAPRSLRRAGCAMALLLILLLCTIMIGGVWDAMPRLVQEVQFPYRLNTYVALCIAALVLVAVLGVEHLDPGRRRAALSVTLTIATGISVAICLWQLWVANPDFSDSYHNRSDALASIHLTPQTWYDQFSYTDTSQPVVPKPHGYLIIKTADINSDHVTLTVTPPPGAFPFWTDIAGGPYAAKLSGALVRAGRTPTGLTVARRRVPARGPVSFSLALAGGWITVGQVISIVAIALLIVMAAFALGRRAGLRGPPR